MTSAGEAAARSAGSGQRSIHSCHEGMTLATGVCWLMTSQTSTAHADVVGSRHGSGREFAAYQRKRRKNTGQVCPIRSVDARFCAPGDSVVA